MGEVKRVLHDPALRRPVVRCNSTNITFFMKIRTYLLLMLLAILVPVAGLTVAGFSSLVEAEREARLHALQEVASSTSLLIDGEVAIAEASLRTVAYSSDINDGRFDRVHQLLTQTVTTSDTWAAVADYEGNGLLHTLIPFGQPLSRRNAEWMAAAYDGQKTKVSGYFIGNNTGRGVVSVGVPTPQSSGKKYVVLKIFDSAFFNKSFRSDALQPGWIIGLFDADGISIARNANAQKFVGKKVMPELYQASLKRTTGLLQHKTRDGISVYDVFVRSPKTGWTVAIGVPVDQIESAARMTILLTALATIGVLAGAVSLALYFGRRIDQAIRTATSAAQELASGRMKPLARSHLEEADLLLEALHSTGRALSQESEIRAKLERDREHLLASERAARLLAEEHVRAKDTFLAMLAHELRNPLSAISNSLKLIDLKDASPSQHPKPWNIVTRQLAHLIAMVNQLLDVNRISSGKVVLNVEPVDVGSVVQFCCDSCAMGAIEHIWDVQLRGGAVLGDKVRLLQVFDNLLTNASKFTPAGGTITVRCYKAAGEVIVEVSDTGVGIAPDVLPGIFDSLIQGPTTIDRAQGGLGLGLSIARGLVRMHGGDITAHSAGLGSGSCFTVRLPSLLAT